MFQAKLPWVGRGRCESRCVRGSDTKANTPGCGALEVGDLRLLEDGRELAGALRSDGVVLETVHNRRSSDDEKASVSAGADTKANTMV